MNNNIKKQKNKKIIHLLDNIPNQPSRFKTKYWIEKNENSWGIYEEDNQIRFKTWVLRSSLCNYIEEYVLLKVTITVENESAQGKPNNAKNKKVIIKNCIPFTNCRSRKSNTQVDDAHDIDVIMSIYSLIKHNDNYSKTSEIFWRHCRNKTTRNLAGNKTTDFTEDNAIADSFEIKAKITDKTSDDGNCWNSGSIKICK